jgi:hypothetical protein
MRYGVQGEIGSEGNPDFWREGADALWHRHGIVQSCYVAVQEPFSPISTFTYKNEHKILNVKCVLPHRSPSVSLSAIPSAAEEQNILIFVQIERGGIYVPPTHYKVIK